jgi:signal transduction histidine kinase/ligand-binding sensor domain-containing protein
MLWIWKYFGPLDRYDRKTGVFHHYDLLDLAEPGSATSDFIWTLYEDPEGTLWAGTYRSGLFRYNREMDQFMAYRHDPNDPGSLSSDRVYAIYEDSQGSLWVGTLEGLNRFDRETGTFAHYRHDPDDPQSLASDIVQHVFEDGAGRLWVASLNVGLEQLDPGTGRVLARHQHDPGDPQTIDQVNNIKVIYEDQFGLIWLVHFDGRLDRFDPERGVFSRYRHDPEDSNSLSVDDVSFLTEDQYGALWIGTAKGLHLYDRDADHFVRFQHEPGDVQSLSGDQVTAIYEDEAGVIWVATDGNGLNLFDPKRTKFTHYRLAPPEVDPQSNNVVYAILEDREGIVWTGTDAGLNRFDRATGQVAHYQHDPADAQSLGPGLVAAVFEDRQGRLWIGTQSGLDLLDRTTGLFTHFLQAEPGEADLSIGAVYAIIQDRTGNIWLGRHRYGLCRFDPEMGQCTRYAYDASDPLNPEDMVTHLYEDEGGTVWVGTQGGLVQFDPQTETLTLFTNLPGDSTSLSYREVTAIAPDRSGNLWVGTAGGGLNWFDRSNETFDHYTDSDGLPSNVVLGILTDAQANLWLSTSNGLSRFNPQTGAVNNYDTGDGLQDALFLRGAAHESADRELFFGGMNGFNAFRPEKIQDSPYVPPVVLTSLTQGGVELESGTSVESLEEVTLQWPNNFFEFEFAALSYSQSDRNQYAYRLEGFRDEAWNLIGTKRFGRYTNLPGGAYTLRMKGSNSDGVWNEEGARLEIRVVPPLWESWWLRGLGLAILVLVGVGAYLRRTRGMEQRSRELERQVTSRTKELAALNAIGAVVSRSLDRQQILADALDKTLEVTEFEAGGIYLVSEDKVPSRDEPVLSIAAHRGLNSEIVEAIDDLAFGEGFTGHVAQTCEPLVVTDIASDPRLSRSVVRASGLRLLAIVPVVSRAAVIGTLFVATREELEFTGQDVELLSSVGSQIGVAVENARLFAAEQRRSEQFRLINRVGRELTLILDVDKVLRQVTRMIQTAFGYYHVAIGLIEADEVVYRVGAGELWDDPAFRFKPARLKLGEEGISGWVAASGEPLLVPDVSSEPRYVWMQQSKTRSELTIPILVKGKVAGVLDVQSHRLNAFDDTDFAVLQSLAHQIGAAIENARLYEQAQQAAVMAERSRLARDLHDAVTQSLFSASLIAEAVPATWAIDPAEGEQLLSELRQLTRGALAEMRTLLLELRPAALVETGLVDLLHQLAEAAMGRIGIPVTVTAEDAPILPPDVHVALYRIAQEAVNNVVKHSRAGEVDISLRGAADLAGGRQSVELLIRDDGRGFDAEGVPPDHLGLGIMRERAEAIGAELQVESGVGRGTCVRVRWHEDGSGAPDSHAATAGT